LEKEFVMTAWERVRDTLGELYAIRREFETAYSGTVFISVGEALDGVLSTVAGVNMEYAEAGRAQPLEGVEGELRSIRRALDTNWAAATDLEEALKDIERVTGILAMAHDQWRPLEEAERHV
jgi:hypothetical protein